MSAVSVLAPLEETAHKEYAYCAEVTVMNNLLKIVCVGLAVLMVLFGIGMFRFAQIAAHREPWVVRVNGIGQAEGVNLKYASYTPQDAEMRYFLTQFVTNFYSRNRKTLQILYPASLYFLDQDEYNTVDAEDRKTHWAAKFLTGGDDDADVDVKNVALDESRKPLYRAEVPFVRIYRNTGGAETKREQYLFTAWFRVNPAIATKNNEMEKWNPLGFQIVSFRADKGFE